MINKQTRFSRHAELMVLQRKLDKERVIQILKEKELVYAEEQGQSKVILLYHYDKKHDLKIVLSDKGTLLMLLPFLYKTRKDVGG